MKTRRYLTTDQMCRIFNVCSKSVHAWAKRKAGFIRPVKVFRSLLWPEDTVSAWIEAEKDKAVGCWERLQSIREETNDYGKYRFNLDGGRFESDGSE